MLRDLPVEIEIRKNGLSSPGDRLLGKLEDHHLGQLLHLPIRQSHQVGCEEEIDRIPADRPGKVALKGCGKLDHVGQQNFGMFGRLGHGDGVGKAQAEAFDVFEGLAAAVGPIDKTQVMEMKISPHVGIGDLLGKDGEQGIFLLDPLGQGQVGGLGPVGNIGILFVGVEDELIHIVERHSQTGMHLAGLFQPPLDQFGIHQLTDQGSGDHPDLGRGDQIFHLPGDLFRRIQIDIGFPNEGIDDPLSIPVEHRFVRSPHEEGHIRGLNLFPKFLPVRFHFDHS